MRLQSALSGHFAARSSREKKVGEILRGEGVNSEAFEALRPAALTPLAENLSRGGRGPEIGFLGSKTQASKHSMDRKEEERDCAWKFRMTRPRAVPAPGLAGGKKEVSCTLKGEVS